MWNHNTFCGGFCATGIQDFGGPKKRAVLSFEIWKLLFPLRLLMKLCSLREVVRAGWDLNATSIQFNFPPSTWIIILWLRLEHQYRTLQLRWWSWHNCRIIIWCLLYISHFILNKSIFLSCVAGGNWGELVGNWGDLGTRILRCQKSFCATLHTTQTCHYWYFTYKYGRFFLEIF